MKYPGITKKTNVMDINNADCNSIKKKENMGCGCKFKDNYFFKNCCKQKKKKNYQP